jgi:hypothetical protein
MDHRFEWIMNANIATYHIPVNADIQDIDVISVEEQDERINKLGINASARSGSSASLQRSRMRSISQRRECGEEVLRTLVTGGTLTLGASSRRSIRRPCR